MRTLSKFLIAALFVAPIFALADSPYVLPSTTFITTNGSNPGLSTAPCPSLSVSFERGARDTTTGGQVTNFQKFLAAYYAVDTSTLVTGYFGPTTQSYAIRLQKELGLPSAGFIGALTRAAIAKVCGGTKAPGPTSVDTSTLPSIKVTGAADSAVNIDYKNLPPSSQFVFVDRITAARTVPTNSLLQLGGTGSISVPVPDLGAGEYYIAVVNSVSGALIVEGRALNISIGSSNQPSCSVTADKSGYVVGDTVILSYTSKNATSALWSADSLATTVLQLNSTQLNPSGSVSAKALAKGLANLTLAVTGASGSGVCKVSVSVSDKPLPSCTLSTDKTSYKLGDLVILTWTTADATSALWAQSSSGPKLSTGALSLSGGQGVVASTLGSVAITLNVVGPGGAGSCTKTVSISQ